MLITGIIGRDVRMQTTNLINAIFNSMGKKASIIDSKNFAEMDFRRLKNYLSELDKINTDVLILKIDLYDVEKEIFNYINFDIIMYTGKAAYFPIDDFKYDRLLHKVFSLLNDNGAVIVNIDDAGLINFLQGKKYYTVTYGFNSKASITASSVGDEMSSEGFMCCLQRAISAKNGLLVEPQEYKVNVDLSEFDTYGVLAALSFAIVNGANPEGIL